MPNLTAANIARMNAALDKLYSFEGFGITSFRRLIDAGEFASATAEQEPVEYYNRIKFNRMNAKEQEAYEKRLKETKTVYRLVLAKDEARDFAVPKMVYDYFNELHRNAQIEQFAQE